MPLKPRRISGEKSYNELIQPKEKYSNEDNEGGIDEMYGDFDYNFGQDLNKSPLHNRRRNVNYEHDGRPVFNYQNPDFGKRRRQYSENSFLDSSISQCETTITNPVLIEMNEFLNSERIDDSIVAEVLPECKFPDESELVHRHHRTTSIHRNATFKNASDLPCRSIPKTLEERRHWMGPAGLTKQRSVIEVEEHANNIATRMQQDGALMEDGPESKLLRREALRNMPQCLTVKRIIKKKLKSSASLHSKHKPINCSKRLKYYLSMKLTKMQNSIKSLSYTFELWYSGLKTIEGHFGSGIATYFKFLRWLFMINCLIALVAVGFIVLPQLLHIHIKPRNNTVNINHSDMSVMDDHVPFHIQNIFDGEGYFTNTILYYGFYTTDDIVLVPNYVYHMPYAYFFTMSFLYIVSFCVLSMSMARSYRQSFIETQGGLKNVYAHKIFCGWDYGIATEEAAHLKSSFIYHELKEMISDAENPQAQRSWCKTLWTYTTQIIINIVIVMLLIGIGYVMWFLLEKHSMENNNKGMFSNIAIITAILINVIIIVFPTIFGAVVRYEDYRHPRAALYITLIRIFLLKSVVVGVFIGFWLTHSNVGECWETSIGQHIYRLILFDFLFSFILGSIIHITRYIIYKKYSKKLGIPEFDIAQHTLQLMYNQTLFWVGFYFSPMLSVIVIIKLWCTWYLKKAFVLYICKPSSKAWKAAQTQTLFLILSFLSLLLVLIAHGYILVSVKTSNCGPLRKYPYMYEIIRAIFKLEQDNKFWKILLYFRKPGTVALIFVAMSAAVYYLRAKAKAQTDVVKILREMLVLEAKDKEFLLKYISKVTDGGWSHNLDKRASTVWKTFENAADFTAEIKRPKSKNNSGDSGTSSGSSTVLLN